jgi:hypothetical protein
MIRSCAFTMAVFVSMFYIFGLLLCHAHNVHSSIGYFFNLVERISCIIVALYVVQQHHKVCGKCQ